MASSLINILLIGHSLIGTTMPLMLQDVVGARHAGDKVNFQIINGAPLVWNWDHSAEAQGVDARAVLPGGDVDVVVMTEAVPLLSHTTWSASGENAFKFYDLAVTANPDARVYLFETWHSLNSGTGVRIENNGNDDIPWRVRIDQDLPLWESIVDFVNDERAPGQPEMLIVPGGQAMALLHDEIADGTVPGTKRLNDVFGDDIHPNDIGAYFIAMVQYATIYGESPVGLPTSLRNEWGQVFFTAQPDLAERLQEIAWEAVRSYPRSGVASDGRRSERASPTALASRDPVVVEPAHFKNNGATMHGELQ
ncbi:hypothetical protein GTW25_14875 [Aliihoeflea aestuarii]|jgi:hypothetical protein|uniref:hypothetical protein n=1 Tax=Aliihoeflea aestuarii TaxID=453840 RepID=UPI00209494FA|nr:hypothetical protein [Aliihoeflea aestuarii]MCO6392313.1 hypothetical protein [Aliihoeflea aestuarii]